MRRLVGDLWPGQRDAEPARFCGDVRHAGPWAAEGARGQLGGAFLPGVYQGTHLHPTGGADRQPRANSRHDRCEQRAQLDSCRASTSCIAKSSPPRPSWRPGSRASSWRTACSWPRPRRSTLIRAVHIKRLYGLDNPRCDHVGRQCLVARRLVERGVRFVQIYSGGMDNQLSWDGHNDIKGNHEQFAGETDKPIAGLLTDLSQRGLLRRDAGDLGRRVWPAADRSEKREPGRDHNPHAFTFWMAGGGVKGGISYGETDEIGYHAVDDRVHVNDLHATILHLIGLDHERLTYKYNGRRFRLTDVAGKVITKILA